MRIIVLVPVAASVALMLFSISFAFQATALLQTGQKQCYNTAGAVIDCSNTGQDGEYRKGINWGSGRYKVSGPCWTDSVTGLTWTSTAGVPLPRGTWRPVSLVRAANYYATCDYTDWRMPNINELQSLVHSGFNEESCDGSACATMGNFFTSAGFLNIEGQDYWSGTTYTAYAGNAWVFDLEHGGFVYEQEKSSPYSYTWFVRGRSHNLLKTGQTLCYSEANNSVIDCGGTEQDGEYLLGVGWSADRHSLTYCSSSGPCPDPSIDCDGDSSNDIVTDNLTGMIWPRDANKIGYETWQGALDAANILTLCGHGDWRLPNRNELMSLIDRSMYEPAISMNHPFLNVQSAPDFWSSTTNAGTTAEAWVVGLGYYGKDSSSPKSWANTARVWPVRGGTDSQKNFRNFLPLIDRQPLSNNFLHFFW